MFSRVANKSQPMTLRAHEKQGASDIEIHDAVLIAAAFCMYNRYVDGLATFAPKETEAYIPMGERMAHVGYTGFASAAPAHKR